MLRVSAISIERDRCLDRRVSSRDSTFVGTINTFVSSCWLLSYYRAVLCDAVGLTFSALPLAGGKSQRQYCERNKYFLHCRTFYFKEWI